MKTQNSIRVLAGGLTLISALLGYFVDKNWLFVTMFVGLNLFQYGFSNWCAMEKLIDATKNKYPKQME